ncbi:hypothetical protein FB382_000618 [Nocardioides ginsengisegetis]|uniref:Secreted protein n=1 Tax=Nocardioides ginsengisegetis TaxID=661491 RepID=A0A7W3IX79_9ACTN|nr:hypothetical protein [Nocardioides ginsengisegetis]MBA8802327.1 hypothetical protein [Nocardioides ginsengisegetis]
MNHHTTTRRHPRWSWTSASAGAAAAAITALLAGSFSGTPAAAIPVEQSTPPPVTAPLDPTRCPSLPDPRFVGGPWAHTVPGCPEVSQWWKHVQHR